MDIGQTVRLNEIGSKVRIPEMRHRWASVVAIGDDWITVQWDHRPKGETWDERREWLEVVLEDTVVNEGEVSGDSQGVEKA